MNETKIEAAIKEISGRFIDLETEKQNYKEYISAIFDELMASEDLTKDDCNAVKKVAEELAKEKLDILSEKVDNMQTVIDIYKKNNVVG